MREAKKKELLGHGLSFYDDPDKYPVIYEDKARNFTARQAEETGRFINFIDWYVPNMTEAHWQRWSADPAGINDLMNPRLTAKLVNSDDGYKTYYYKMRMPLLVSNRYVVTTFYYDEDKETGWRTFVDSSDGNEPIIAALKDEIGSDTPGYMYINYVSSKPYDGGMQIRLACKLDYGGYLPTIVKKFISKKLANFPV